MRPVRQWLIGTLAAAGLAGGCAVVAGLDGDRTMESPGSGGAGTSTATQGGAGHAEGGGGQRDGGGAPDAGGCKLASVPAPPDVANAGGSVEVVAAIRALDVGDTGTTVGLDLDAKCTCEGDGPSCRHPDWMAEDACDGPEGRDARTTEVFRQLVLISGGSGGTDDFTSTAELGSWTMIVRVLGWNGLPDDDRVTVSVFPSSGLPKADKPPKWDGTDRWPVPNTAIAEGGAGVDQPRYVDLNAYVSGSVLVASLPESEMLIAGSSTYVPVHFIAGFLTGRLVDVGGKWGLREGVVAARWKLTDIFRSLSAVKVAGNRLCTGDPYYIGAKKILCELPDITGALASPTAECDAVSVGMLYDADPATIGDVTAPFEETSPCDPGKDPTNDTCP